MTRQGRVRPLVALLAPGAAPRFSDDLLPGMKITTTSVRAAGLSVASGDAWHRALDKAAGEASAAGRGR